MHFLCLHGIGTNSHVLESQTAAIRYEMDLHHTYDFVEGCESTSIAPEIKDYFAADDDYFQYYNKDAESTSKALTQLHRYIEEEGPFDGVIAFSQGVALTLTYLLDLMRQHPGAALPFRCAILFSGTNPLDGQALTEKKFRYLQDPPSGMSLTLPVSFIWGGNDKTYGASAATLPAFCDPTQHEVYIHGGGHEIPGVRARLDLQNCMKVIRRTIERASLEC